MRIFDRVVCDRSRSWGRQFNEVNFIDGYTRTTTCMGDHYSAMVVSSRCQSWRRAAPWDHRNGCHVSFSWSKHLTHAGDDPNDLLFL